MKNSERPGQEPLFPNEKEPVEKDGLLENQDAFFGKRRKKLYSSDKPKKDPIIPAKKVITLAREFIHELEEKEGTRVPFGSKKIEPPSVIISEKKSKP